MILRSLTKQEVEAKPYKVWNAYVDLLTMEEHDRLAPEQRPAHLVFWYESEVQNGGHFQYFENRGTEHLDATVEALGLLGATCQQQILREAGEQWLSRSSTSVKTAEEFAIPRSRASSLLSTHPFTVVRPLFSGRLRHTWSVIRDFLFASNERDTMRCSKFGPRLQSTRPAGRVGEHGPLDYTHEAQTYISEVAG
jgi:hypothetical protein